MTQSDPNVAEAVIDEINRQTRHIRKRDVAALVVAFLVGFWFGRW